jgi:phosphoserine phosphatase SerB
MESRNSIIHDRTNLLYQFWRSLEANDVHPLAIYAHRKQESLIACASHAEAQVLAQKLKTQLRSSVANLSIAPYEMLHSDACILNPIPRYSTQLFNLIGFDDTNLCQEMANLFQSFIPFLDSNSYGPIVQSINIEKMRNNKQFHARFELRFDGQHSADEDLISTKFDEISLNFPEVRIQGWSGPLQLQTKKTILFYATSDFTNSIGETTLIEDAPGVMDAFTAGAERVAASADLSALSSAIKCLGYAQKLLIELPGSEARNSENYVSLSSVLDLISDAGDIDNTVIVHLDREGMENAGCIRAAMRVAFQSTAHLASMHHIHHLKDIKHGMFHLIGHLPSDVAHFYENDSESSFLAKSATSSNDTASLDSKTHRHQDDQKRHSSKCVFLETSVNSLQQHSMFLYTIFSAMAREKYRLVAMDGMRLIQTLDAVLTISSSKKATTLASLIPNSVVLIPTLPSSEKPTHVITIAGPRITSTSLRALLEKIPHSVADVSHLRQLSISSSSRLPFASEKAYLGSLDTDSVAMAKLYEIELDIDCVELLVHTNFANASEEAALRILLRKCGLEHSVDVSLQRNTWQRRNRRAASFDMDSTLIQLECIDEMAHFCGVGERVKEITHRAMSGELDFQAALRERVLALEGALAHDLFAHVVKAIRYTPHARLLCHSLRALGFDTAVFSGGFFPIIDHVKRELRLRHARANVLELSEEGKLTGKLLAGHRVVDADAKEKFLRKMCTRMGTDLELSLAAGDGANDLKMLGASGLGVAFLAKETVRRQSDFHINHLTLSPILFLLGLARDDILSLLRDHLSSP